MKKPDVFSIEAYSNRDKRVVFHHREALSIEGEVLIRFVEHYGMITATSNGEDSTGRQRLMLLPPDQVVDRAREMTRLAFDAIRAEGWSYEIPSFEDLTKEKEESE
ncbi:MAG: hypothetical protein C5B50_00735 [Verrucomicrobia bacterium]|nr:MAG: hypothetical protein C5B50_00735 [Verrucomicrobiota bacterium]